MIDVYFYEAFAEEEEALRRYLPKEISAEYTDRTIQECDHKTPPARMISTRTQSRFPAEWSDSLDAILSRSTGYDHLTAYAAGKPKHPAMGYLPLYCHTAVAEQAMLLWMALLRRLPRQLKQFNDFNRDMLTGQECRGRTLVVVGVGNVGSEICRIGTALGMRVLGVDLRPRFKGIEYESPDAAFPQADIVVAAMDLNATNRGYFNAACLGKFKRGALFVNVARGELSPSSCLLAAMREGILRGVALDVFDHEAELAVALRSGKTSDDVEARAALELAKLDNVLLTPHNSFNTEEAVERKSEHSVRQIVAFRQNGRFEWPAPIG
jgi:D-lactate dehydrogenase